MVDLRVRIGGGRKNQIMQLDLRLHGTGTADADDGIHFIKGIELVDVDHGGWNPHP